MKIIENLGDVPNTAGDAELVLRPRKVDSYNISTPLAQRNGKTIFLEENEDMRFYQLLSGRQFLYTANDNGGSRHMFFGGTDENPFLVELELSAMEWLVTGEEAFFEGLKPLIVKKFEQIWATKAKRQGDFLAVTPKRSKEWGSFLRKHLGKNEAKMSIVEKERLRNTRHTFQGLVARVGDLFIGEGIIEAPDHGPLKLIGPHIIEQAVHLLKPQEAD